ncbi:acyl-CoA dehydrogenase family protein [Frankia sp. Cas4]|uniref:acyl-CoA dehydrogenase family protein n=1 Tax=Frankia sp. Cas4 TaxID=3073927 RepID=UPI002AD239F4|nr:acyl-CoA dehydrogenase family protein [Frankia sp. Cas4]
MITFILTDEQKELRSMARRFFESRSPESEVRRLMDTDAGFDPDVWEMLSGELGLAGLIIPEEHGGSGASATELGIVLEEAGRALLCAPLLSSAVLAAQTLLESNDAAAQREFLPRLATGRCRGALAVTEEPGSWDPAAVSVTAMRSGDEWVVSGTKSYVLDGHTAQLLIVSARTGDQVSLLLVDADAQGVAREVLPTMDQTRKQARITFHDVSGRLLGSEGAAPEVLDRVFRFAAAALAAEQVGGAQRVLEMAVDHAKARVQFGRTIGSFQAIKHRCADLLVEVESARSAAYFALACFASASENFVDAAHVAKAYCSDAFTRAAAENIQIHGGIGFTWEHPAHLYLKRAKASGQLLGSPAHHRDRLGRTLGI